MKKLRYALIICFCFASLLNSSSLVLSQSITGDLEDQNICEDDTLILPKFYYQIQNPNVVSIDSLGRLVPLSIGLSNIFYYPEDSVHLIDVFRVTVHQSPSILNELPSDFCAGDTASLDASTDGIWKSNNPDVASISSDGFITFLESGQVGFIFSTAKNCIGVTEQVTVANYPLIELEKCNLCLGETTNITSDSSGQWIFSNPDIVIIDQYGEVTPLKDGVTTIRLHPNDNNCISEEVSLQIDTIKKVRTYDDEVCPKHYSLIYPKSRPGGYWHNLTPSIGFASNETFVGLKEGTAYFHYVEVGQECVSDDTLSIEVIPLPEIGILGDTIIEPGGTTQLTPMSGGTWTSTNTTVANVDHSGLVTSFFLGTANFCFQDSITGCHTCLPSPIQVTYASSSIEFEGNNLYRLNPNPASDQLMISPHNGIKNLNVFSTSGMNFPLYIQDGSIDISNLPKGYYVLSITTERSIETLSFIKI